MREALAEQLPQIEALSDHALLMHCLALTAFGTSGRSSFELHTPLELMARYRLLSWVGSEFRHMARAQMLATALDFRRIATPLPVKPRGAPSALAIGADTSWQGVAAVLQQPSAEDLCIVAQLLGERIIANVGAAGHGHLLLAFAADADGWVCERLAPHLRAFVEWFASDEETEGAALFENLQPLATAKRLEDVRDFLAAIARNSAESEHGGIRGIVDRARQAGFACHVAAGSSACPVERCVAALEVAARFMLLEETELEYGWSHCLTLPEAACTLGENATPHGAVRATAVAISYVAAFVSALRSGTPLPTLANAEEPATRADLLDALMGGDALHAAPTVALRLDEAEATSAWALICSLASVRPDAHLVKYVLACLRCANGRSRHPRLFLAAAAKLLAAWLARYPAGTAPADLLIDRLA